MKRYETFQEMRSKEYITAIGLDGDTTLEEIIGRLTKECQFVHATGLLLGNERIPPVRGRLNIKIYMHLVTGRDPDLLIEIAGNHYWAGKKPGKGFAMEIHAGEWFIVKEPTASKLMQLLAD